jgi:hypothetical protein
MRRSAEPESDADARSDGDAGRRTVSHGLVAVCRGGSVEFSGSDGIPAQAGIAMCLRAFVEAAPL